MNIVLDRVELILYAITFFDRGFDVVSDLISLVLQLLDLLLFLGFVLFREQLVLLDLLVEPLIVVLQCIGLLIEHVDVVEQAVVLFLSLDEGGHDLVDVRDTAFVLDLLKGLLDYHCVLHVLVN